MPASLTRLISQIGVVLGQIEQKFFGGPLSMKGLVGVSILALGLLVGGCWGIISLLTPEARTVQGSGSRGSRVKMQSSDAQDRRLLECDASEAPPEDEAIYVERACTTLGDTLADLTDEEFQKTIENDYLNQWIVEPGWTGRITRIIRLEGPAGPRSIVTILEGGGRIRYQAKIRAATTESVAALRVGDYVHVRGWICDMLKPTKVSTTRGKANTTPGVVLLAGATIERD